MPDDDVAAAEPGGDGDGFVADEGADEDDGGEAAAQELVEAAPFQAGELVVAVVVVVEEDDGFAGGVGGAQRGDAGAGDEDDIDFGGEAGDAGGEWGVVAPVVLAAIGVEFGGLVEGLEEKGARAGRARADDAEGDGAVFVEEFDVAGGGLLHAAEIGALEDVEGA